MRTMAIHAAISVMLAMIALTPPKCFAGGAAAATGPSTRPSDTPSTGVAVVELFTSEGCSSCPPADELFSKLADQYAAADRPVFFLALHIDYWDHLGWSDPFADAFFSSRQRQYARGFGSESVYTPQLVVNGVRECIGSDRDKATTVIDESLTTQRVSNVTVTIDADKTDREFVIHCRVTPAPPDAVLNVALVESGLSSSVRRGENAGRKLRHDNVVRVFRQEPLREEVMQVNIKMPKVSSAANSKLIVFAQDRRTLRVLGATAAAVPDGAPRAK